ncbi:hypothetical protein ZHAS_00018676 [Anopheles sinensis]|uniref:Uncharacterized protein n=1 Tax=Anopheles sinensis TaxID=74873 RepID=A0A084WK99_ANOSI|nr:hypothetical protein ZHAS_00018676 [Anopheles sinensis]
MEQKLAARNWSRIRGASLPKKRSRVLRTLTGAGTRQTSKPNHSTSEGALECGPPTDWKVATDTEQRNQRREKRWGKTSNNVTVRTTKGGKERQ